ncbi:MAG TPA: patatin-like phospholipase family protein [Candidatus Dormibacteraeota bacterium]|nr:patatin-like phospholipase family protein [Candidatus Dormibacteraeota bacterium]
MAFALIRPTVRTWVLGGGGGRGAAQVGVIDALMAAGVEPPNNLLGVSVGALNGFTFAAFPSRAGVQLLRETWLSRQAQQVFKPRPLSGLVERLQGQRRLSLLSSLALTRLLRRQLEITGIDRFEQLRLPLGVGVTDLAAGHGEFIRSGPLLPALLASAAVPAVFPSVALDGRRYIDGGVADNDPIGRAVTDGAREVIAISLMAGPSGDQYPSGWGAAIVGPVMVSLHLRLLGEFERWRGRARITVLCPLMPPRLGWDLRPSGVGEMMERAREATARLLAERGSRLFRRSGIHYLDLGYEL